MSLQAFVCCCLFSHHCIMVTDFRSTRNTFLSFVRLFCIVCLTVLIQSIYLFISSVCQCLTIFLLPVFLSFFLFSLSVCLFSLSFLHLSVSCTSVLRLCLSVVCLPVSYSVSKIRLCDAEKESYSVWPGRWKISIQKSHSSCQPYIGSVCNWF